MAPTESAPDRYALVGHPVAHSRSPLIHQLFARQTRQRMTYELIDAEPAQFETAVRGFKAAGGLGMNVTVPHKEAAFALARAHGEAALIARAANTLTFSDGSIRGDNTDGIGFMRDVTVNPECEVGGARVLLLGAGGATRGLLGPLLAAEPAALVLANRTLQRATALRDQFAAHGEIDVCSFADLADRGGFDILINATSAGLHGEQPPFPPSLVTPQSFCYDLAYSINVTPFVAWASAQGAGRAVQGWGMLIEQAAESFAIWRGVRPDTAPIRTQLER
jgi:shikimate dehydrogenase